MTKERALQWKLSQAELVPALGLGAEIDKVLAKAWFRISDSSAGDIIAPPELGIMIFPGALAGLTGQVDIHARTGPAEGGDPRTMSYSHSRQVARPFSQSGEGVPDALSQVPSCVVTPSPPTLYPW